VNRNPKESYMKKDFQLEGAAMPSGRIIEINKGEEEMSSEQETLSTIPKQFHDEFLAGDPKITVELLDDVEGFVATYDIMLAAIDAGESYMARRLQNDTNQAKAYRILIETLKDELENNLKES